MEQVRMLVAVVLSILIFAVWAIFFQSKKTDQQTKPAEQTEQAKEAPARETGNVPEKTPETEKEPVIKNETPVETSREPRMITIRSPLYTAVFSDKGAVLKSFTLNNYRQTVDKNSGPYEMISENVKSGTILSGFEQNSIRGLEERLFTVNAQYDSIDINDQDREVVFSYQSSEGIAVRKKYTFSPDTYVIGMEVSIENGSNTPVKDSLALTLKSYISKDSSMYLFEGPSAMIGNKIETIKPKKIEKQSLFSGNIHWVAIQDRYFISSIIPKVPEDNTFMKLGADNDGVITNRYVSKKLDIAPGTEQVLEYELYVGPKSIKTLEKVGFDLDRAVSFGWFDFLAKPCLWLMNQLYKVIPNYGVAIIILTLLTKILLWPLGTKGYKSMNEMKKLQPLMAEIREKYKDDKKKMNEELMGLYRTYKINPVGGCLPMIVQIPVFFALYRMLYGAIELRHAPFFGWINDLSAPDRLFNFELGFKVPLMDPPYGIPVLTILMGASMLISQKMQPPAGDPTQAKMMMLMPVVFTFIFINFSSGLVLYWLVNNILSIAQQYYTQKKHA